MVVEEYLLSGSHVGDPEGNNVCYSPVFISDNDTKTWFLGNMFLNEYYTVFDMTPFNERGENYLQVGFAKQSKENLVFEENGGDKYDAVFGTDDEDETDDESSGGGAGTFFLVVFLLGLFGSVGWYLVKGF
jgi:hypothetical protein